MSRSAEVDEFAELMRRERERLENPLRMTSNTLIAATGGFMVGLMEWTCLKVLAPHLNEGEGSLGVHIDVSHIAATVPGQTVTVDAECTRVEGRRVWFKVRAHDGIDLIGEGRHERMIIPWTRFVARVNEKAKAARVAQIERVANSE